MAPNCSGRLVYYMHEWSLYSSSSCTYTFLKAILFKKSLDKLIAITHFHISGSSSGHHFNLLYMKWDVCISTSTTQRSSRGNTLVQLFEMQAKAAAFLTNIYFYLKEQVTDKLWLFRLGYFQIFLENEPSEPVT